MRSGATWNSLPCAHMCVSENTVTRDKGPTGSSERREENPWCKRWEWGRPRHRSSEIGLCMDTNFMMHLKPVRWHRWHKLGHKNCIKQVYKHLRVPEYIYELRQKSSTGCLTAQAHNAHINNAPSLASYAGLTAPRLQGSPPALRHTAPWDAIVSLFRLVFNPVNEVPPE